MSPTAQDPKTTSNHQLVRAGLDPHQHVTRVFGMPAHLLWRGYPPWMRVLFTAIALWAAVVPLEAFGFALPPLFRSALSLVIGLLFIEVACEALVTATERLAARRLWDHYVAGTVAEIVATLPEIIVICFVIPVSPLAAL
ncbi:MAG TPA: hypothetical protein VIS76_00880, partial [Pseudomonadales bacterium]